MNRKGMFLLAACVLIGSLLAANGLALGSPGPDATAAPSAAQVTMPQLTLLPSATPAPTDEVVSVPDAKLKAALHDAAGLAAAAPLHQSDLARLSGGLNLMGKGIADAEGLQWCVNLSALNLADNKLTAIPTKFSQLAHLQTLVLEKNKFSKFPDAVLTIPKLTVLSLKNNALTKLPDNIYSMSALTELDVSANRLAGVPSKLGKLLKLNKLSLADNELRSAPKELFQMPALSALDLAGNLIEELPKEAGSAPALKTLVLSRNRLTEIDPALLNGKVTTLLLEANRLTALPKEMNGKTFDAVSVEWNYIDMSADSPSRKIIESVTAPTKEYLGQLVPLTNLRVVATSSTVSLQWPAMKAGTDGDGSWQVECYYVYQVDGDSWKQLAELDGLATQYVAADLKADKEYQLMLGVEYSLKTADYRCTTRSFTPVKIKTVAEAATAPAVMGSAPSGTLALATSSASAAATPAVARTAAPQASGRGHGGLILALAILGALAAAALIAAIVLQRNKKKRQ